MTIKIPTSSQPNDKDLQSLARAVGHKLPKDYLEFVRNHNGAEPESNSIRLANNETGIRSFVSVREASSLLTEIDRFPNGAVILAEDGCGNYFYMDPQSGGVHFWDHEMEGEDEIVGNNLTAFLEKLSPFDPSKVKLNPGQLKSAWIDPEFKKRFGK